jgi:hypothetical protein
VKYDYQLQNDLYLPSSASSLHLLHGYFQIFSSQSVAPRQCFAYSSIASERYKVGENVSFKNKFKLTQLFPIGYGATRFYLNFEGFLLLLLLLFSLRNIVKVL